MKAALHDLVALLTFRMEAERLQNLSRVHLALGLAFTWLVGMGRYWDNPRAHLAQLLGVGSLTYIFALGIILWLIFKPLVPERVRYLQIVTFLSLTSAPAILYAIPVERFMSLDNAGMTNVWFLAIVALWRVALLFFYMARALGLALWERVFTGLLPLAFIVVALTALNLEHVIFRIMAGISEDERTANDAAYMVLITLTILSVYGAPPILVGYLVALYRRVKARKRAKQ